jgi:MFS transporter, SP family, general alpha glucoside:H+ symporter
MAKKLEHNHVEHNAAITVDDVDTAAAAAQEHKQTAWQAILDQPTAVGWCLFANFCGLFVSFENQAAGVVLSIPEFRKDFGYYYDGSYVLYTDWQSAFYGGPIAGTIFGTLCAGWLADRFGRKPVMFVSLFLSFAAIAIEFVATTNAVFFVGKLINGFLTGALLTAAMTYNGEVRDPDRDLVEALETLLTMLSCRSLHCLFAAS